ncbi:MAG: hypothetical protein HQK81_07580 [Desulfovibrionaceae bacterium]|nr:hypothetical protein [Desulfovibrionaceae bacterium]MBF0513910.1 hypothetical protein [Desulfovibrionaceae bacterium]
MTWQAHIPDEISRLYEVRDYRHAAALLSCEFRLEFEELCGALMRFRFRKDDVLAGGGNESRIPKTMSGLMRPLGWLEGKLTASMVVDGEEIRQDTHKVDFLKGRVAFDLEWNSKDQTFDRDLYAFRTFFEFNKISVGVIVTRSDRLDPWFKSLGQAVSQKYGASTTHLGKLLPRLEAGRSGGCPILVLGMTPELLEESS